MEHEPFDFAEEFSLYIDGTFIFPKKKLWRLEKKMRKSKSRILFFRFALVESNSGTKAPEDRGWSNVPCEVVCTPHVARQGSWANLRAHGPIPMSLLYAWY